MMKCSFEEEIDLPNGGFRRTKCVNTADILVINDPCYGLCYVCAYNQLKAENEKLKVMYEAAEGDLDDVLRGRDGLDILIDELQAENKRKDELLFAYESVHAPINPLFAENKELKRKAKIIKVGNLIPPDFDPKPTEFFGNLHLDKPENAYHYGWQSAILECGEILNE